MSHERLSTAVVELARIMSRLRRECPWDKEQTHSSLRRYLLEECYEVLEALDEEEPAAIRQELGDLLFQIWFHAELASERDDGFELSDVLDGIREKLVRRHPHIFADSDARDSKTVLENWEQIKLSEGRRSLLDGIPKSLPALAGALSLSGRAATVGFDWSDLAPVRDKVNEELGELLETLPESPGDEGPSKRTQEEFGDLLFALVNYGRHIGVVPEDCLRGANSRFAARFQYIEESARERGIKVAELSLDEMERLWEEAKARLAGGTRTGEAE